ncbi:uncharacterized protein LOC131353855 [Hemibagrus wyckioides]|uniref:uncharacterized protein LOC131353855 n=1 Tax=Hemibagrus wyckioides TaxID=337641 RepID=UPI00266D4164|nr:uncharacterized protein LOC131353855 [Hemibagrus wyckioides]
MPTLPMPSQKLCRGTQAEEITIINWCVHTGCRLNGNCDLKLITAYTGGSVLLSCSCTDLHRKPETFTWMKLTAKKNNWEKINPDNDQYKERFQLVNDHSSGNLSLLISHLTEEDEALYMCSVRESEKMYIRLTVKGCTLNQQTVDVTGNVGQSVLLPCSCSELQAKPHTFTWSFLYYTKIFPADQKNCYTDRVQLFNDHPPGNLSLLISHLTVEDGGWYRCEISEMKTYIYLTVKGAPTRPSSSTPVITTTSPPSSPDVTTKGTKLTPVLNDESTAHSETSSDKDPLPYIPVAMVTVIFLHVIVAVVYCTTRKKGPGKVHYSRGDERVSLQ